MGLEPCVGQEGRASWVWCCQRYLSFLVALVTVEHGSAIWAANLGRMDNFLGRDGKKPTELFCWWVADLGPILSLHAHLSVLGRLSETPIPEHLEMVMRKLPLKILC